MAHIGKGGAAMSEGKVVDNLKIEVLVVCDSPGSAHGFDMLLRLTMPDGKPPTEVIYKPRILSRDDIAGLMAQIYDAIGTVFAEPIAALRAMPERGGGGMH